MNPLCITLLACLVPAVAPPEGADEARAILDRAIEAHGGEDRIARTTVGHVVARGKFALPDFPECDVTWEETFDLPGRYRRVIKGKGAGRAFRMEYALTDRSGWLRHGRGEPTDIHPQEGPTVERSWHTLAILLLVRDGEGELTALPERDWKGRRLVGFRAEAPLEGELYFDKATGLLALSRRALPNLMPGKAEARDLSYEGYKEFDGVLYPTRLTATVDGATVIDLTVTSLVFLDKVDDKVFARPAGGAADDFTDWSPPPLDLSRFEGAPVGQPWFGDYGGLVLVTLGVLAFLAVLLAVVRLKRRLSGPGGPDPDGLSPPE